jgi:hypothetical protein
MPKQRATAAASPQHRASQAPAITSCTIRTNADRCLIALRLRMATPAIRGEYICERESCSFT